MNQDDSVPCPGSHVPCFLELTSHTRPNLSNTQYWFENKCMLLLVKSI